MGQYQRKHQRKTRRVRFTWLYGVISALLILAAVVGGCIVFFRVDTINVQGNSRYTQEEIVAASGIEQGDNMFLINKFQVIDQMISQLTYLDDVTIRRGLPSTLNVTVTECTVAGAVRRPTDAALRAHPGLPVLCSGGVASNSVLRAAMPDALFAAPEYSTDNAMGAAILAHRLYREGSAS